MTRMFLFSVISFLLIGGANAATPWWNHDDFCQISPTNCYANMGAGYEPADWDTSSNCWGKKYICAEAITDAEDSYPVLLERAEIARASRINSDFDVTALNGDCFGVRKTKDGGTTVSVDNEYVKVWCNGILDNPDEDANLANGEIPASGNEPTCEELKTNGYVGIQNGKCYGKYYEKSKYFIQCDSAHPMALPTLIVLNGVDPNNIVETNIKTKADADDEFRAIYQNAQSQHQIYFKN